MTRGQWVIAVLGAVALVWWIFVGVQMWQRHQVRHIAVEEPLGALCDEVAAKSESPITVGWYESCIREGGKIIAEERRSGDA